MKFLRSTHLSLDERSLQKVRNPVAQLIIVKLSSKPMIKSFDFLQAWRTAASNRSAQLLASWTDYKLYTSLVLNNPTCLLVDVGNALGLQAYPRDYYAVDGLLYSQQDFVPDCP